MDEVANNGSTSSKHRSALAAPERNKLPSTSDGLRRTPSASGSTDGYILSGSGDLASEGVYEWPRLSSAAQGNLLKKRGMKKAGRRMNLIALNLMKAESKKLLDYKSNRAGSGLRRTGSYNRL